jgi:glucose-6-phosphate 1-dehydrogenase
VGLEGRKGFYDDTGALRDMVQNHMLQLLALTAMEPPVDFDATAIRDEKVKVLRATSGEGRRDGARPVSRRRGEGRKRQGYEDDLGQPSETETFVAIKAHVENWRWQGVPFYLRTGKRLGERRSEIVVEFKQVPHNIFGSRLRANRLVIRLQPEEYVRLQVMAKEPGLDRGGIVLREVNLDLSLTTALPRPPPHRL